MTPNRFQSSRGWGKEGFTLIETLIAVGIVATGLLTIIAMVGTNLDRFSHLANRDAALRLRSTLLDTFQDSARFPQFYEAIREGAPIYAYCYGGDSVGENGSISASQSTPFALADHHVNGVRITTDADFAAELAACPFVFRVQFEFFDVATGEEISPADLPALSPRHLPAALSLFWLSSERVADGDHSFAGRPVTTFNAVLKP